jgi:hypothetical protein
MQALPNRTPPFCIRFVYRSFITTGNCKNAAFLVNEEENRGSLGHDTEHFPQDADVNVNCQSKR